MRLSDFLREHSERILLAWDEFAATVAHSGKAMDQKALRDHAAQILLAIADDLDAPQDALRPRLVAAAAMAALTSLDGGLDEQAEPRTPVAKAEALAVLDDAILFLRGGLDALQEQERNSGQD